MALEPNFGLAKRQILGRCPDVIKWTPSKPLPWWAGRWEKGRRFTAKQEAALIEIGRDPVTAEAITVSREAAIDEVWSGIDQWRPIYQFEAPRLGDRADGKVTIIAPDGSRHHIRADGWAAKPSRRPWGGNGF